MNKWKVSTYVLSIAIVIMIAFDVIYYFYKTNQIKIGGFAEFDGQSCQQFTKTNYYYFVCENGVIIVPHEYTQQYQADPNRPQHTDAELFE